MVDRVVDPGDLGLELGQQVDQILEGRDPCRVDLVGVAGHCT